MPMKSSLIAAALSAHLGVDIKSESHAKQLAEQKPGQVQVVGVNLSTLFKHTYDVVKSGDTHTVRVFGQDHEEHDVDPNLPVLDIKKFLAGKVGKHHACQKLIYRGKHLVNDQSLVAQGVPPGVMILAWGPEGDGPDPAFYIKDDDLDPPFDYDFTNLKDDGKTYERGGYVYHRPYGWDRCALKVLGRYPDDVWLGQKGIRTDSSSGEWAVSYHGTAVGVIGSIADGGYDLEKCTAFAHGKGIYSTPSMKVASTERYAKKFKHKDKYYRVVFQNRVNLAHSNVISAARTGVGAAYFVTPDADNIRPYGVCLKEM